MKVITVREFYANQNKYFEMIANEENVIIKRKEDHYKIVPVVYDELFEEKETESIPRVEEDKNKAENIQVVIVLSTIGNIKTK